MASALLCPNYGVGGDDLHGGEGSKPAPSASVSGSGLVAGKDGSAGGRVLSAAAGECIDGSGDQDGQQFESGGNAAAATATGEASDTDFVDDGKAFAAAIPTFGGNDRSGFALDGTAGKAAIKEILVGLQGESLVCQGTSVSANTVAVETREDYCGEIREGCNHG